MSDVRCLREKLGTAKDSASLGDYPYTGDTDTGILKHKIRTREVQRGILKHKIRTREVKRALTSTPRQSAAGPDCVSITNLRRWDQNGRKLAIIFDALRRFESAGRAIGRSFCQSPKTRTNCNC